MFSTIVKRISQDIPYISFILYTYISYNILDIMVHFVAICPINFCMSVVCGVCVCVCTCV